MVAVYDNWDRLVRATLRREELRISGLRTPSDIFLASSSSSFSFRFSSSSRPQLLVGDSFSYQQILQATDYLSSKNLIKQGRNWDLFYGVLEGGTQVVVKKVDLSSPEKESYLRSKLEFFNQVSHSRFVPLEFFNKVSHSRFVPLLGHCWENWSEKFLVYKYMPSKDLSSSLHREKYRPSPLLDWRTRIKIATEAAEGLCYLHHKCVPHLVHRNVDASSILLDENFGVRIGGLHEVCVEKKRRNQSRISKLLRLRKGSEQGTSGVSDETCAYDVYCFGKVLLELVRGKNIFNADNDSSMRDWIANSLDYITPYDKELCVNILDPSLFMDTIINPSLIRDEHLLLEVWAVAVVAKACLSSEPSKRPQMTYILKALQDPKSVMFSAHGSPQSGAQGLALAKTQVPKGDKLGASVATTRATFSGSSTASLNHQFPTACWDYEAYLNKETLDLSDLRIYSFSELKAATGHFRNGGFLGEDRFGSVFKGWIDEKSASKSGSRSIIAIKIWNLEYIQGIHDLRTEIDILGKLSHPNLIKLLGYFWEAHELILVYEFMQKGTLDNHLTGRYAQPIPWNIRLKILIGVARGLAFLHESNEQVIYKNFNSSNILLDGSYNAKISGFGLTGLGPWDGMTTMFGDVRGSYGYMAPECVPIGCACGKSDVYCFGVVLAEVLTGQRAFEQNTPTEQQRKLVDWIKPYLSNEIRIKSILDPKLQDNYPIKAILETAQLALTCLSDGRTLRPSMKEVVDALEYIKSANEAKRT